MSHPIRNDARYPFFLSPEEIEALPLEEQDIITDWYRLRHAVGYIHREAEELRSYTANLISGARKRENADSLAGIHPTDYFDDSPLGTAGEKAQRLWKSRWVELEEVLTIALQEVQQQADHRHEWDDNGFCWCGMDGNA